MVVADDDDDDDDDDDEAASDREKCASLARPLRYARSNERPTSVDMSSSEVEPHLRMNV